jgi:hypothetical protein
MCVVLHLPTMYDIQALPFNQSFGCLALLNHAAQSANFPLHVVYRLFVLTGQLRVRLQRGHGAVGSWWFLR